MSKIIFVIGVGGRTGTMFTRELEKAGDVFGVGLEKEIKTIKEKKLYVSPRILLSGEKKTTPEVFSGKVIKYSEFQNVPLPDIIFLTTTNPVGPIVKYYYESIKNRHSLKSFPILVLSQNGLVASKDAKEALREVLGKEAEKVQIIRVCLFNPVDGERINDKIYISYSLPIRLGFGVSSGSQDAKDIKALFKEAGIKAEEVSLKNVDNMEFSKLFLNLIGMVSATKKLSPEDGFENREVFKEEIEALREYIKVVGRVGGNFLNFSHYPVRILAFSVANLPLFLLTLYRKRLGMMIAKKRGGKPKDFKEIEYYNGAVVRLGKEVGISTPVNQKTLDKAKEIWEKQKR